MVFIYVQKSGCPRTMHNKNEFRDQRSHSRTNKSKKKKRKKRTVASENVGCHLCGSAWPDARWSARIIENQKGTLSVTFLPLLDWRGRREVSCWWDMIAARNVAGVEVNAVRGVDVYYITYKRVNDDYVFKRQCYHLFL